MLKLEVSGNLKCLKSPRFYSLNLRKNTRMYKILLTATLFSNTTFD